MCTPTQRELKGIPGELAAVSGPASPPELSTVRRPRPRAALWCLALFLVIDRPLARDSSLNQPGRQRHFRFQKSKVRSINVFFLSIIPSAHGRFLS